MNIAGQRELPPRSLAFHFIVFRSLWKGACLRHSRQFTSSQFVVRGCPFRAWPHALAFAKCLGSIADGGSGGFHVAGSGGYGGLSRRLTTPQCTEHLIS